VTEQIRNHLSDSYTGWLTVRIILGWEI